MQGTYSDVLVQLSNVYSQLRGDSTGQKNEDAAQVGGWGRMWGGREVWVWVYQGRGGVLYFG